MSILLVLTLIFGSSLVSAVANLDSKIVDGVLINITQAPWIVSIHSLIRQDSEKKFDTFLCSGVIVGPNEILTAGHCLIGSGSANREIGGKVHYLDYVRFPPFYQPNDPSYDVAFARVYMPFQFSETIKKINLRKFELKSGSIVTVSGWGATDPKAEPGQTSSKELRAVNLTMWDKDECYSKFNVSVCFTSHPEILKCMKNIGEGSGKSACRGDSGSPVVYQGKLAGILSGGLGKGITLQTDMICNDPGVVNIYNTVTKIRKWIHEMIKESQAIGKR